MRRLWLPIALFVGAAVLGLLSVPLVPSGWGVLAGPSALTPSPTLATSRPPDLVVPTATPGPRAMPDGYRIQIPRLGIDLPIQEGDIHRDIELAQTPENVAFHLPGTATPGEPSNTYFYAHARRGMFLALWDARPGDEVFISTPDGRLLVYVVREVLPRVPPTDVSVAAPTTSERLTLQTSTGPDPGNPRFVVFAYPRG
jgi:hypothetical protein